MKLKTRPAPKTNADFKMVRVKKDILEVIRKQATEQNRSMANYIETLVKKDVTKDKI